MTSSDRQDGGRSPKWSEPVSLHEAVSRSPVLIRLEEGHRGVREDLSFSAGDMMALEGLKEIRGRRLVLAHYASDLEMEEGNGGEQAGVYRALLTLAYDSLPDLDVSMLKDPGGHDYRNFVDRHFPDCNWARQQDQLLENMEEYDYMNVSIIKRTSLSREQCSPQKPPPPKSLPKPRLHLPGSSDTGGPGDLTPPPRPPRPGARSEPSTAGSGPSTATARPGDQDPQSPPDKPPPRPPRGGGLVPPPLPPHNASKIPEIYPGQRQSDSGDFSIPTIAELTSGQVFCYDATQGHSAEPQLPGEEISKEKPKKESTLERMKQMGKKVYASVIRTASPHPPTDESHTDEGDYAEITDDDDYVEENYAEIDVLMMTPAAEEPASGKTDGKSKNEKKAERKREKEAATKQAVRPMVRVLPQGAGGLPLTSHPVPPSSRPPVTRLLMSPTGDQDVYEVEDAPPIPTSSASALQEMSCSELCSRLQKCGMSHVAKACKEKSLDGAFFTRLSNDILMKPPFSLDEFEVNTKLQMIKAGWVPK